MFGNAEEVYPKPEARNPKPEARSPKPETRNPKPETRNPKPETRNSAQAARGIEHFMKVDPKELSTTTGRGMDAIRAEFEGDVVWSQNLRGDIQCMVLSPSPHTLFPQLTK